jgi:hypothetical protein
VDPAHLTAFLSNLNSSFRMIIKNRSPQQRKEETRNWVHRRRNSRSISTSLTITLKKSKITKKNHSLLLQELKAVRLLGPSLPRRMGRSKEDQEKTGASRERKYQLLLRRAFYHMLSRSKRRLWSALSKTSKTMRLSKLKVLHLKRCQLHQWAQGCCRTLCGMTSLTWPKSQ